MNHAFEALWRSLTYIHRLADCSQRIPKRISMLLVMAKAPDPWEECGSHIPTPWCFFVPVRIPCNSDLLNSSTNLRTIFLEEKKKTPKYAMLNRKSSHTHLPQRKAILKNLIDCLAIILLIFIGYYCLQGTSSNKP